MTDEVPGLARYIDALSAPVEVREVTNRQRGRRSPTRRVITVAAAVVMLSVAVAFVAHQASDDGAKSPTASTVHSSTTTAVGDTTTSGGSGGSRSLDLGAISMSVVPPGYVPVVPQPYEIAYGEAGSTGSVQAPALLYLLAPSDLVKNSTPQAILQGDSDQVVDVMVFDGKYLADSDRQALEAGPVAGLIPRNVSPDSLAHRSLRTLRDGIVVDVSGRFTSDDIAKTLDGIRVDKQAVISALTAIEQRLTTPTTQTSRP